MAMSERTEDLLIRASLYFRPSFSSSAMTQDVYDRSAHRYVRLAAADHLDPESLLFACPGGTYNDAIVHVSRILNTTRQSMLVR